jgi:hypothetical protein
MKRINSDNLGDISAQTDEAEGLSAKQELALRAVISHPTLKDAAAAVDISETTLWRYKQDPEFSRRLRDARREAVDHAVLRLQRGSNDAVTVLHELMLKEDAPASARITAARTVLEYSVRAAEIDELRGRVEELGEFIRSRYDEEARDAALGEEG